MNEIGEVELGSSAHFYLAGLIEGDLDPVRELWCNMSAAVVPGSAESCGGHVAKVDFGLERVLRAMKGSLVLANLGARPIGTEGGSLQLPLDKEYPVHKR